MKELVKDVFLTQIVGRTTYHLKSENLNDTIEKELREISRNPCFIYSKINVENLSLAKQLEAFGFSIIDTNIILEKNAPLFSSFIGNCDVDFAIQNDKNEVMNLAASSFRFSRFHLDPNIPNDIANKIKSKWVENFFLNKRGTHLIVAKIKQIVAGFLLCIKDKNILYIDLFAVDSKKRGMGVANDMINFAVLNIPDIHTVIIGTQLANIPSINLFLKLDFKLKESKYIFHYHVF